MLIKNNVRRYCNDCNTIHKKGDMIDICPYCLNHTNHYINLKLYNLSSYDNMFSCWPCAMFIHNEKKRSHLYNRLKEIPGPWI
jgi:hypothetical protein